MTSFCCSLWWFADFGLESVVLLLLCQPQIVKGMKKQKNKMMTSKSDWHCPELTPCAVNCIRVKDIISRIQIQSVSSTSSSAGHVISEVVDLHRILYVYGGHHVKASSGGGCCWSPSLQRLPHFTCFVRSFVAHARVGTAAVALSYFPFLGRSPASFSFFLLNKQMSYSNSSYSCVLSFKSRRDKRPREWTLALRTRGEEGILLCSNLTVEQSERGQKRPPSRIDQKTVPVITWNHREHLLYTFFHSWVIFLFRWKKNIYLAAHEIFFLSDFWAPPLPSVLMWPEESNASIAFLWVWVRAWPSSLSAAAQFVIVSWYYVKLEHLCWHHLTSPICSFVSAAIHFCF